MAAKFGWPRQAANCLFMPDFDVFSRPKTQLVKVSWSVRNLAVCIYIFAPFSPETCRRCLYQPPPQRQGQALGEAGQLDTGAVVTIQSSIFDNSAFYLVDLYNSREVFMKYGKQKRYIIVTFSFLSLYVVFFSKRNGQSK